MLTRKENEVEELRRRVEEAKMKLGSEMKVGWEYSSQVTSFGIGVECTISEHLVFHNLF